MNTKFKVKSNNADSAGLRWPVGKLVLCLVLASYARAISLLEPVQPLSGGVVSWSVVAALLSELVLAIELRS